MIKSRLKPWKWGRREKDSKIKAMGDGITKAGDSSSSVWHNTADYGKGVAPFPFLMSKCVLAAIRTAGNLPGESGGCSSLLSGPDIEQSSGGFSKLPRLLGS